MLSHSLVVLSCFPGLLQMWSPCCLLDVSQMWSPSCLPDVVPRCCFPVRLLFSCLWPISHMWSLSCLLDLVSQILAPGLVVVSLSSTSFPDAVSQLSPRCGFWGVVSHSCCFFSCLPPLSQIDVASQLSRICGFPDAVFQLPPGFLHVLSSCLPLVSRDVVSKLPSYWNLWQFRFVSQNWTSNYLHMSSIRCPVVF